MSMEAQLKAIKHVYSTVYHGEEECMKNATLLPINNAIVYPNNKILYKKSDNTIDFIDISNVDKSIFFDKGSNQDSVYGNVIERYNSAKNRLTFNPDEYQCEMVDSGNKFLLNLINDKLPTIIAISDIYPTYFDLGLSSNDSNQQCLDYSHRKVDDLIHSGDIQINSSTVSSLLHCISGKFKNGMKYVTIISGYNNTPLYRYIERRPIVTIIDHEKKIIYVVSVPLDEFTIGKSTICIPIGITCLDDQDSTNQKLLIEIFSNTKSCDSYLPTLSQLAKHTIIESINTISSDIPIEESTDERKEIIIPHSSIVVNPTASNILPISNISMDKHSVLIYSGVDEIDYFTKKIKPDILIRSMNTHIVFKKDDDKYVLHSDYHNIGSNEELNIGQQHFPNLLPMEGGAILFASKTVPKLNSDQHKIENIRENIFQNTIPIFLIGKMDDLCRKVSTKLKINGIYFCIVDYPDNDIMLDDTKRNQFLENTCMNGVTAYAGPLSLVIIAIMNPNTNNFQYFYVDGIQYENFIDSIPLFGTDITDIVENKLLNYIENNTFENSIVDINQEQVLFNKKLISFTNFKNQMIEMTLDEIIDNKYKILDVMSQCQRIYDSVIMDKYSNELVLLLEQKINQIISEYKKSFMNNLELNMNNKQKLSNETSKIKGLIKILKRNTQELVDKIGLSISKRKQSSIKFNLAQLKKKETIKQNVQRVLNMSYQDFTDLLEKLCDESGVLWLNLDYNNLIQMLKAVKDNEIGKYLTEPILPLINCRNGDFNIDSFTISILLEQSACERMDPIRPQKVDEIVTSLPVSSTYDGLRTSSWFFPLIDKYKNLQIPYDLNWITEANNSDIAAFRIISRGTISNASVLRDLQLNIQPQDKNITWFLIYITLAAIDELVRKRKNDIDINNFNDTFCINIRCLLCNLLTYSASGNVPCSFVWQLFTYNTRPDLPKDNFEWGMYVQIIKYVEYTAWDLTILKKNIRALLCKTLNKIILKATETLRENKLKSKKIDQKEYLYKLHKIYYPYYEKMVRYCKHIRDTNEPIEQDKINEILHVLSEFNNRRYCVGSIHQLSIHLKRNFRNKKFVDKLLNCILYKWDNYDKKYKLKLSEFIKQAFFNSPSEQEKELDINLIQNQLNDFKLKLIEERSNVLSMIDKEIKPITNYDEIQKLFTLIETIIENNKKNLSVDELKEISASLDDIYKNENKYWQPFNPFPQFIKENKIEIYFNKTDEVKEEDEVEDSQDIVLYKSIFKEHYFGIIEQITKDLKLNSVIERTTFNSTDEFIILAKFAGFGQTFEEISGTVKSILHSLLINWEKSADVAEAIALERFI
ncbi:unnamed protein product [Adineta steineri]|uniref:Uncharacterized protein n=1 Tax=Adineta steineri TaxID=433720 RepID=A0A815GV41_9BILA|nr:unnamed protein product [Adineta steineri]CAF4011256.1 unnamed protein product [Adineta steineri]